MNPKTLLLLCMALIGGAIGLSLMKDDLTGPVTPDAAMNSTTSAPGFGVVSLNREPTHDPNADPESLRGPDNYGWKSFQPAMAAADDTILNAHQVVAGLPTNRRVIERPAGYRILGYEEGCTPRGPRPDETLANIHIGHAERPTGLHAYSDAEMAEDTVAWLTRRLKGQDKIAEDGMVREHTVPVANVYVTDTSAPVYLVLQNWQRSVLWNIHTAPRVEIAHVVTVGTHAVALNMAFGAFDIQAFRAGTDCVPRPARKPLPTWRFLQVVENERSSHEKKRLQKVVQSLHIAHAEYTTWFRNSFGQGSEEGVIGFDLTHHVLVGPLPTSPEARLPYRPIHGATVLITEQDHIFTAPKPARIAFMAELQRGVIAEAAGGDLAMLFPAPMERTAK